jgi:hypothetical protein
MAQAIYTEEHKQYCNKYTNTMTAASNSKAVVFRAIAQARRSIKRYQIDREIPAETLTDILQSTIVRIVYFSVNCIIDYRNLLCVPIDAMA